MWLETHWYCVETLLISGQPEGGRPGKGEGGEEKRWGVNGEWEGEGEEKKKQRETERQRKHWLSLSRASPQDITFFHKACLLKIASLPVCSISWLTRGHLKSTCSSSCGLPKYHPDSILTSPNSSSPYLTKNTFFFCLKRDPFKITETVISCRVGSNNWSLSLGVVPRTVYLTQALLAVILLGPMQ